jgi:hypothetical protein
VAGCFEQGIERIVLSSGIERRGKPAYFHASILLGLFDPEDGRELFFPNVD